METRVASSSGRPDLPMAAGLSRAGRLSSFESGEQHQVVGNHGRPDVSPKMIQTPPGAAGAAVGALEPADSHHRRRVANYGDKDDAARKEGHHRRRRRHNYRVASD